MGPVSGVALGAAALYATWAQKHRTTGTCQLDSGQLATGEYVYNLPYTSCVSMIIHIFVWHFYVHLGG